MSQDRSPIKSPSSRGMKVPRTFSEPGIDPYDAVRWVNRTAEIKDMHGKTVFQQQNVSFPAAWSQLAVNVVASKYFYGELGTPQRETSARELIDRVVRTIAHWGERDGYFASKADADAFRDELATLCLNQYGAFNSPVWFNVGLSHVRGIKGAPNNWRWGRTAGKAVECQDAYQYPQGSACFIQSVGDDMRDIMRLATSEAMLFKYGSGTGTDLSAIRSSKEKLAGGGKPSGPVSFMRVYDSIAGVVKSGGKCLDANQYVETEHGALMAVELARSSQAFRVFSYSKSRDKVVLKRATCWRSGEKQIVVVVTQDGEYRVSDDHPLVLADGRAIPASQLVPGQVMLGLNCRMNTTTPYRPNTVTLFGDGQRVVQVYASGVRPVYSIEVEDPEPDDKRDWSEHNYLLAPTVLGGTKAVANYVGLVSLNTRRAAKMQTLQVTHPDIWDFVGCKAKEENKALALIQAGYDAGLDGDAYSSVAFQNANLSVRVTDDFMDAALDGDDFSTVAVTTGKPVETFPAPALLDRIAECAWQCGDPGLQYHDAIQDWHTCPNTAPINSTNPCSEYAFIDDSACNLASINLMKFRREDGTFDAARFRAACRIFITAQEILVDNASYPTAKIAENSHKFRPLGIGYANLGSLLMASGLPYDTDQGRALAGVITAIMTGEAYLTSAQHAANLGPFDGFALNREPMLRVMEMHRNAVEEIGPWAPDDLHDEARKVWEDCLEAGRVFGYRNSQASLLAPTGTIAFMMDCDTTGVEPDIALVKYKSLAGGGMLKIVNRTVEMSLVRLDYDNRTIGDILDHIDANDTIEGAPGLAPEHLDVFDCAFPPRQGGRSIHYRGHLRMMAAVQPFLSGAISKTVNMPSDATVKDVRDAYIDGWRLGLKAVAIYRDGSKGQQPLSTSSGKDATKKASQEDQPQTKDQPASNDASHELSPPPSLPPSPTPSPSPASLPRRERLPHTRTSLTHKFDIQGHEGYVNVGFYPDGRPGELFITMAKEGSTVGGLMDVVATSVSIGLQYGVPLEVFVNKFAHGRFEPSGFTPNPDIRMAKSLTDYVFRWLGIQFIPGYRESNAPPHLGSLQPDSPAPSLVPAPAPTIPDPTPDPDLAQIRQLAAFQRDAPSCDNCGAITVRAGACYRCLNCGNSLGCS